MYVRASTIKRELLYGGLLIPRQIIALVSKMLYRKSIIVFFFFVALFQFQRAVFSTLRLLFIFFLVSHVFFRVMTYSLFSNSIAVA